jgi:subtilisin family serine protease
MVIRYLPYVLIFVLIALAGGASAGHLPYMTASTEVTHSPVLQLLEGKEYSSGEVIVRVREVTGESLETTASRIHSGIGATVKSDFRGAFVPGLQVVQLPAGLSVADALAYYLAQPDVTYAEPNYVLRRKDPISSESAALIANSVTREALAAVTPNDPYYKDQWGLATVRVPEAWSYSKGADDIVIAVLDSGVDTTHADLRSSLWKNPNERENGIDDDGNGYIDDIIGYDFYFDTARVTDTDGHGTACAGLAMAGTNNGIGIAGVLWTGSVMILKTGPSYTNVEAELDAIAYAGRMGADIVSCSFGGYEYIQSERDLIAASPALFICAAGNDGTDNDIFPSYPSSYDCSNIIAVAATDRSDRLASEGEFSSNYGATSVDVAAPGARIIVPLPGDQYSYGSGTSFAVPFVAGLAGLVKAKNPSLSNAQIKDLILKTATPLPALAGKTVSGGRIDAYRAVLGAPSPGPQPTLTPTQAPAYGSISVTSSPPGATISLNGAFVGFSPRTLTALRDGTYRVVLSKTGYVTYEETVVLRAGAKASVSATLVKKSAKGGSITVTSVPSGASVSMDGRPRGSTPITLTEVQTGSHELVLKMTGYLDWRTTVSVAEGGTTTVSASLSQSGPTPGGCEISVSSVPTGGTVFVDGVNRGTTPVRVTGLSAGTHEVGVKKTGYFDWSKQVTLRQGVPSSITALLTSSGVTPVPTTPSPTVTPRPTGPVPTATPTTPTPGGTGTIAVNSYPWMAPVTIDGTSKGTTPRTVTGLSAGSHVVVVTKTGYYPWEQTVTVTAGAVTTVTATLRKMT